MENGPRFHHVARSANGTVWEQQADALFIGHNIEQIRHAEKQSRFVFPMCPVTTNLDDRADIESKKEELRQMVGYASKLLGRLLI